MSRDIFMMNENSLIYMISTASDKSPCLSKMKLGRSLHVFIFTCDGFFLVIFPYNDPILGPRMSSALMMSAFVISAESEASMAVIIGIFG